MPQLTSYTKDTETNILSNPPSADGELAFSTDSKKFFISDGTQWIIYKSFRNFASYDLDETYSVSTKPMYHFDTSDSSKLLNSNSASPSNGDSISKIICKSSGTELTSEIVTEQPTYVSATGTSFIGQSTGDARIGGKNILQFDGTQFLAYDYNYEQPQTSSRGWSFAYVGRVENIDAGLPTSIRTNDWNPVFGNTHNYGPALSHRPESGGNWLSYFYFNVKIGHVSSVNRNVTSIPPLHQTGNYPFIFLARTICASNGYIIQAYININNSQYSDITNSTSKILQNSYFGFILGATGTYKTSGNRHRGEIGEVLTFDSMLSTSDMNKLGNYLAAKWSLNWSDIL